MRVRYEISIVLLLTCLYRANLDMSNINTNSNNDNDNYSNNSSNKHKHKGGKPNPLHQLYLSANQRKNSSTSKLIKPQAPQHAIFSTGMNGAAAWSDRSLHSIYK